MKEILIFSVILNVFAHMTLIGELKEHDKDVIFLPVTFSAIIYLILSGVLRLIGTLP